MLFVVDAHVLPVDDDIAAVPPTFVLEDHHQSEAVPPDEVLHNRCEVDDCVAVAIGHEEGIIQQMLDVLDGPRSPQEPIPIVPVADSHAETTTVAKMRFDPAAEVSDAQDEVANAVMG